MDTHADLVYSHTGYDVISYIQSAFIKVRKTAKYAFNGFGLNFCGAVFCMPQNWWASC